MAIIAELKGKLEGYRTAAGVGYVDAEDSLIRVFHLVHFCIR